MTVSTLTNKVSYIGNGAATSWAVPFKVLEKEHLVVKRRLISSNEIDYTYVGTDYSYSGLGADSGTLTLSGTALSSSYKLEIERIVPYTQELDIVNAGGFYPETVEEQLDLTTMQIQQIDAQSDDIMERAVLAPVGTALPDTWDELLDLFRGLTGPAGSGNIVGIHLDDYLTHSDSGTVAVAANNAGLAEINAIVAAADAIHITAAEGVTYWVGGLENQPYSAVEIGNLYNWYPTVPYLFNFDGLSFVKFEGNGATFKNRDGGKFGTFNPLDGTPRSPTTMPYVGAGATGLASPFFAMILVKECTGIVDIKNLILNGNKAGTEIGSGYGDTGIQIPFTGVMTKDNTARLDIDVEAINFGLDGIHVREGEGELYDPRQRSRIRIKANDNGRNGISIVGGRAITFYDCEANRNGSLSNPKAGVDVEAESGRKNRDIVFDGLEAIDNSAQALVMDTGDSADIHIRNFLFGKFVEGASDYVLWPNKPRVSLTYGKVFGTIVSPYATVGLEPDFFKTEISSDPANSPTGVVVTQGGFLIEGGSGAKFTKCTFVDLDGGVTNGSLDLTLYTDCSFIAKSGYVAFAGRHRGVTRFVEEGTGDIGAVPGGVIAGKVSSGHAEDRWSLKVAAGTTTSYPPTLNQATGTANLFGSKTHNFGSIADGAQETTTVTLSGGAALGDFLPQVSLSIDHGGLHLSAYVSATNTATVIATNNSGGAIDLASATLSVRGHKKP